ncbi:choline transporter-like 1 [Episyrphus balteatus]|uniref:choline transporter-like 1 n=1 Tax=Episyrphus balteatus TaxID=286459 RepID=UPI002486CCA0|nr:choline transporter-like 1 [Episyrphus balteatus]
MKSHQNRSSKAKTCKDSIWIYLFLIFWCFLIVIIVFSIINENYAAVINGADSFGNICNQANKKHFKNFSLSGTDTSNKPYLFYFDIKNFNGLVKICVEHCHYGGLVLFLVPIHEYQEDYSIQFCFYDLNVLKEAFVPEDDERYDERYDEPLMSRRGPCPLMVSKSIHFKNRCLIDDEEHDVLKQSYALLNSGGIDQSFFIAIYQSWTYVVILCGFAFAISLIILGLMFRLTKNIACLIVWLTVIINVALCICLWINYNNYPFEKIEDDSPRNSVIQDKDKTIYPNHFERILWDILDEFRINNIIILILAILTTFNTIILITLGWFLRKDWSRLKLLFDEAIVCIRKLPGLIIAPMIALFTMILLISLSGYTLLCITTSKFSIISPTIDYLFYDKSKDPFADRRLFQQIEYVDYKMIRRSFWIYIIGFFWTTEFIFAFEEFCIGNAVALWYFSPSKTSIDKPSLQAIGLWFKYHLGTIAKGSVVISLVKFPKLVFTLVFKSIKPKLNELWLKRLQNFEERIGIWNHNAYVPAAMITTDLRTSSEITWKIFTKNAERVENIKNIFDLVLFLSKFLVAILTCLLGIILLKFIKDYLAGDKKNELIFYMAPVLFSTFSAFCIARIIFSVFEMTVDVLLLSACEDYLMNGKQRRSMMKSNLTTLFQNKNSRGASVTTIKIKHLSRQPFSN